MELAELLGVQGSVSSSNPSTNPNPSLSVSINITNADPHRPNMTLSESATSTASSGGSNNSGGNGSNQMVVILTAQRDRYKERLAQVRAVTTNFSPYLAYYRAFSPPLQAENSVLKLQQQLDSAAAVKANLEADNLTLYSKIRFLQSYPGGQSGPNHGQGDARRSSMGMGLGSSGNRVRRISCSSDGSLLNDIPYRSRKGLGYPHWKKGAWRNGRSFAGRRAVRWRRSTAPFTSRG